MHVYKGYVVAVGFFGTSALRILHTQWGRSISCGETQISHDWLHPKKDPHRY